MNHSMPPRLQRDRRTNFLSVFATLLLLTLTVFAQDTPQARRLILKDGTYQLATKYEVKGDRVRYLSSERDEWEEIPNSLIDWPATEKYEKDRAGAAAAVPEAVQLDKELESDRAAAEAARPEVAPRLHLPDDSGVFLLESFQGEPQLEEIQQVAGDLARSSKANIFRGAINPVGGQKENFELDGPHAPVQSHVDVPSLYIKADDANAPTDQSTPKDSRSQSGPQQPQQPEQAIVPFDRFRIVHADVKNGRRIIGDVKRAVTGKVSQEQHFVKTTITRVNGGWFKVTPMEPLPLGEYALVEMMGKEGMNLYVWDFGVNPKAPANPNPSKPEPKTTDMPTKSEN
jgi:hypothetical protein